MSVLGEWILMITVLLCFLAKSLSVLITMKAVNESSPEVGSSKKITEGSVISSQPIFTRFLSPPETPLMNYPPIKVF